MDATTDGRLSSRPAASAEAENAALTAQVLETGIQEKDGVVEAIARDGEVSVKPKKVPKDGMKNYFVSQYRSFHIQY